jgi:hypothetical protein
MNLPEDSSHSALVKLTNELFRQKTHIDFYSISSSKLLELGRKKIIELEK